MIDWRICAAMCNFTHRGLVTDGENSRQVAERMLEIERNHMGNLNPLNFLLTKQLNNTARLPANELREINDFPRLSIQQLKNEVFCGSYHSRMGHSYLREFQQNATIYILNTNTNDANREMQNKIRELRASGDKIIGVKIAPRHSRSRVVPADGYNIDNLRTVYKIFIQYTPNINNSQAIIGNNIFTDTDKT